MPTQRVLIALTAVLTSLAVPPFVLHAGEVVTTRVAATAHCGSRTSLAVSTETLRFDTRSGGAAVASVDFIASARTRLDGEVLLTVELVSADGLGGTANADPTVTLSGEGNGTLAGVIKPGVPVVAGRWTGSGRRGGRLRFSLNAAHAGVYTLPVRFVLTAP